MIPEELLKDNDLIIYEGEDIRNCSELKTGKFYLFHDYSIYHTDNLYRLCAEVNGEVFSSFTTGRQLKDRNITIVDFVEESKAELLKKLNEDK